MTIDAHPSCVFGVTDMTGAQSAKVRATPVTQGASYTTEVQSCFEVGPLSTLPHHSQSPCILPLAVCLRALQMVCK